MRSIRSSDRDEPLPPVSMSTPLLSVRDLRTSFYTDQGIARAVDGVSFDVHAGETLGIVGESGCGKTVTSLSIMGLLPQPPAKIEDGSSIRFLEGELVGADVRRIRALRGNEIAMIFQEPMSSLNPVYTVGNQIVEVIRLHRGMDRKAARQEAVRLLAEVGISNPEQRVDEYPHQLSGGMRQRVMIAMALSCEPKLLIADEPTTALDVTIQAQILELLAELRGRHGMAVMLITHDLGVVAEVCDRVVVMYAGQIVESGTVHEIFADPKHPYTRGLLDSLPSVDDPGQRLESIPGTVPSPTSWPAGCRFEARCSRAAEGCERPQELIPLGGSAADKVASGAGAEAVSGSDAGVADRAARCWRAGA